MNHCRHERDKQCVFDSFCKKVLKHEARDYYIETKRKREREVSFSELSDRELAQLSKTDKYFSADQIFDVLGSDVVVSDEDIADALRGLSKCKRDIILLSYFLELSDGEIGKRLSLIRSTVQYRRSGALRELRKFMNEVLDYD